MIQHRQPVARQPAIVNVVEDEGDLIGFRDDFLRSNNVLGLDSETTGLDIYSDSFQCRVVQFGNADESWVIPVERGGEYYRAVKDALYQVDRFILQNAAYDLQVFEQTLGVPMEHMWRKVTDTKIMAHLIDPRSREEGGSGHSLEDLTRRYIDPDIADNVKTLMTDLAKAHKTTKANIWKVVDYNDPHYQLYAGMDPILAYRLWQKLKPLSSSGLVQYEHELAEVCSYMERTGFLLDVEYTEKLSEVLTVSEGHWTAMAATYGCENVNSPQQVADALQARGAVIPDTTPTGNPKVDKRLLTRLAGEGDQLAEAVIEAKKARKWRTTWVDNFLRNRDGKDRCHAAINPLRARTARMSVTGIPAQTLPAGDHTIRRCFLADEGQRIASVDYQAQELRVLAALSGDRTMIQAFKNDADLHLMTAQAAFGDHITKDSVERKYAKVVNFGRVYGGGAKTVAEQTGIDLDTAKRVVAGFDRAYPGVTVLSQKLQKQAREQGYVKTTNGRLLPVDPNRAYSALNYVVQSTSRDVTGRALIRLHKAGITPYLRLPIHDEVLASVPAGKAQGAADLIAEIMAEQMGPVHISTDAEVGKRSWGSLYGSEY